MQNIEWDDFLKVELRVGGNYFSRSFAKARKPAYILHIYFGEDIGVKKSSAQITDFYQLMI